MRLDTKPRLAHHEQLGGAEGIRTPDPLVANEVRYQLRYSPKSARKSSKGPDEGRIRSRLGAGGAVVTAWDAREDPRAAVTTAHGDAVELADPLTIAVMQYCIIAF